ncbi:uncharacterized protein DS421_20g683490 [Arachis hypogaea]|nr:uncharacterized protein DS421_20g683490 [Arachis hypogaea]
MLEAQPVLFRRRPSRRCMLRLGVGTDDRGWTSLHVKGDFKLNPSFNRQALLGNLNNNNAASNKFNGELAPAVQVVIPRRLVIQIQRVPQGVILKHGQCSVAVNMTLMSSIAAGLTKCSTSNADAVNHESEILSNLMVGTPWKTVAKEVGNTFGIDS